MIVRIIKGHGYKQGRQTRTRSRPSRCSQRKRLTHQRHRMAPARREHGNGFSRRSCASDFVHRFIAAARSSRGLERLGIEGCQGKADSSQHRHHRKRRAILRLRPRSYTKSTSWTTQVPDGGLKSDSKIVYVAWREGADAANLVTSLTMLPSAARTATHIRFPMRTVRRVFPRSAS